MKCKQEFGIISRDLCADNGERLVLGHPIQKDILLRVRLWISRLPGGSAREALRPGDGPRVLVLDVSRRLRKTERPGHARREVGGLALVHIHNADLLENDFSFLR